MFKYTTAQTESVNRIHDAIAREFAVMGPGFEDHDDENEQPSGQCLLSEWVIVSNWVDEENDTFTVTFGSHGLSRTHRIGLLDSHLHD